MSRTINPRALAFALVVAALFAGQTAQAQTLGDLAEAQRTKQQVELLKSQKDLREAEAAVVVQTTAAALPKVSTSESQAELKRAVAAARPRVVVHSLYAQNGSWTAELASGQGLAVARIGMDFYGERIASIDQRGVVMARPCSGAAQRKKASCAQRVLSVGEAL